MEIAKPVYFYSDKLDDIQKYLKTSVSGAKRTSGSPVENYTVLIRYKYHQPDDIVSETSIYSFSLFIPAAARNKWQCSTRNTKRTTW